MEGKDGKEGKKRKLEDSNTPELTEEVAAKLLGPLTKEQLVDILKPAIIKHSDLLDGVRKVSDKNITSRKLFVRGLGFETTSETLESVFAQHGEIEDAIVVLDKVSQKNKGYGFVTYKYLDGALTALEEPSKKIDGRMVVCNLAHQQQQQQQPNQLFQQLHPQQPFQQHILQPIVPLQPIQPIQPIQPLQPIQPIQPIQPVNPSQPAKADESLRKIFVANVPSDMKPSRLTNFFSQYGDIEEGPGGYDIRTGKSKGFSLILYKTAEAANRSLEDPVKSIDGHQLFCKLALEGQKQKGVANQGQAVRDSIDKNDVNPSLMNHPSQYGVLGHGLVNPALLDHQNTRNPTSLAVTGLNHYGLNDPTLSSLSRDPAAMMHAVNSSASLDLGRRLFLQGSAAGRTALGAGSLGINPYGSSGYGSHPYSSYGDVASHYGIPSSSSVAQTAAYDGASRYPLASYQSQLPGTSPSSGVLPGMRSYYTS